MKRWKKLVIKSRITEETTFKYILNKFTIIFNIVMMLMLTKYVGYSLLHLKRPGRLSNGNITITIHLKNYTVVEYKHM